MAHTPISSRPAAAKPAEPASALQSFLGRAPLLRSESAEAYDELTAQCAAAVEPQDMIERLMVRDYVDLTWEILRLRRMKPHIVTVGSPEAVCHIVRKLADKSEHIEAGIVASDAWNAGGEAREALRRDLAERDVDQESIETHAFLCRRDSLDHIAVAIAEKERMRRAVLRDLEAYRASSLWAGRQVHAREIEAVADCAALAPPAEASAAS